jgi:peptide/nickel transport system permease protein
MSVWHYTLRRLIGLIPTVIGLLLLIFLIARIMPGDPVRLALGPEATQAQVEALRQELGLDQPLWKQFIDYVRNVARGDFGTSLRTFREVSSNSWCTFRAHFGT